MPDTLTSDARGARSLRIPWRLSVSRDARPPAAYRAPRARRRLAVVVATSTLALGLGATPAAASSSTGSATATVNVGVRALTVSPGNVTFDTCDTNSGQPTGSVLSFPDGICLTVSLGNNVTVTNGQVPDHIDVQGADAIPADLGTHWTLCDGPAAAGGLACTGAGSNPGQDQFTELATNGAFSSPILTIQPQCDTDFATSGSPGTCAAGVGTQAQEQLHLGGPSSSTDTSTSFTTVWTWTAVP